MKNIIFIVISACILFFNVYINIVTKYDENIYHRLFTNISDVYVYYTCVDMLIKNFKEFNNK